MSASSDSTGVTHSIQKFLLIRARVFAGKFHLDIYSSTVRNAVAHEIGFTVLTDVNDTTILGKELPHRMVTNDAAVFTEGYDYLVLQLRFGIDKDRLPFIK